MAGAKKPKKSRDNVLGWLGIAVLVPLAAWHWALPPVNAMKHGAVFTVEAYPGYSYTKNTRTLQIIDGDGNVISEEVLSAQKVTVPPIIVSCDPGLALDKGTPPACKGQFKHLYGWPSFIPYANEIMLLAWIVAALFVLKAIAEVVDVFKKRRSRRKPASPYSGLFRSNDYF